MKFTPNKKPILPRYADSIADIAGFVHPDGTIQPDLENLVCYFDDKTELRRYQVLILDENVLLSFGASEKLNMSTANAKRSRKHGQVIRFNQLPKAVQAKIRFHVTPIDLLIDAGLLCAA